MVELVDLAPSGWTVYGAGLVVRREDMLASTRCRISRC